MLFGASSVCVGIDRLAKANQDEIMTFQSTA